MGGRGGSAASSVALPSLPALSPLGRGEMSGAPIFDRSPSVGLALARFAAEGMAGIDAEDADLAREEAQLFEGEAHRAVLGVPLDIGVELRRREAAADHVALEF